MDIANLHSAGNSCTTTHTIQRTHAYFYEMLSGLVCTNEISVRRRYGHERENYISDVTQTNTEVSCTCKRILNATDSEIQ
jgi:hypothetical protein